MENGQERIAPLLHLTPITTPVPCNATGKGFYIKAPNANSFDEFGYQVAISGDGSTLAVGTFREDSQATGVGGDQLDNSLPDTGAVYIFVRSGSSWAFQEYIKSINAHPTDYFSTSLALSADGNTLAIGAYAEESASTFPDINDSGLQALSSGAVYIYARSDTIWSFERYIKAPNTDSGDTFGRSLSLSADGNTLAVGAPTEGSNATGVGGNQADNSTLSTGAAYVYIRSGGIWSFQEYIKASNAGSGDQGRIILLF